MKFEDENMNKVEKNTKCGHSSHHQKNTPIKHLQLFEKQRQLQ
jgi:hypothetical protein